jgi:hypothetical protein
MLIVEIVRGCRCPLQERGCEMNNPSLAYLGSHVRGLCVYQPRSGKQECVCAKTALTATGKRNGYIFSEGESEEE